MSANPPISVRRRTLCVLAWLFVIAVLFTYPGASAVASVPEIVVEDPADDVAAADLPLGPVGGTYDIVRAGLRVVAAETLEVWIEVVAAPAAHVSVEFPVVFRVDGTWYMGGYTALPYPGAIPTYQGGFACPATEDGFVNGSVSNDCIGIPDWTLEGTTYRVEIPREFVNATNGSAISDVWAYAEVTPYLKGTSRVDVTAREGHLMLATPEVTNASAADAVDTTRTLPSPTPWLAAMIVMGALGVGRGRARWPPARAEPK